MPICSYFIFKKGCKHIFSFLKADSKNLATLLVLVISMEGGEKGRISLHVSSNETGESLSNPNPHQFHLIHSHLH